MFVKTKIALAAAIVIGLAATATAAPKSHRTDGRLRGLHNQFSAPPSQPYGFINPNSPGATGGGSLGYNQDLYRG